MRRSVKEIEGYAIRAKDGEIGKVNSFYFDDQSWAVRYLVVDTGNWLPGPLVLIHPSSLAPPDWSLKVIPVSLSVEKVKNSPGVQIDRPVSRQYLATLHEYYRWPAYWSGPAAYGPLGAMGLTAYQAKVEGGLPEDADDDSETDPHLRSTRAIQGYRIRATDGDIGRVDDFIVDDDAWVIRYVVVDTGGLFSSKKVLVSPEWIEKVSWSEHSVHVGLTVGGVERSPEFDPSIPVSREYERRLYDYYGRPRYWQRLDDEKVHRMSATRSQEKGSKGEDD
jgi:hypothetical protein